MIILSIGPHTWAENFEEARGPRQSPINISTNEVTLDPRLSSKQLTWSWPNKTIDVTNTGYGWKAHVHGEETSLQGGPLKDTYQLEQYHMHWGPDHSSGSEHLVDGQSYAGEVRKHNATMEIITQRVPKNNRFISSTGILSTEAFLRL